MSFKIGSTVGSYEIVGKIGRGGMATVYKGRHIRLKRDVAIKVLHPMLNEDDSFLRRFDREAQLVAQLEHPHIVPVYDFAEHDGQPYLVMRLVEGDTLKKRISQGSLSRNEIARIAQAVADGLDYAHRRGVLHRDIKPSNIMLTSARGVYIADFGLARMVQAGESTLSQDMIMGTPQYISPEQAMGNKDLDGRTDLYSFGIILYELVTGQAPFQSETTYSIIHMQIFDVPPLPSSVNENIPPSMETVLLKALSKEPDGRYDTANELVKAFKRGLDDMPEDFAPTGVVVLPDYTPMAATRMQADEVEVEIEAKPETAVPPLPEIVTEEETPEPAVEPAETSTEPVETSTEPAEAPDTEPAEVPTEKKRSKRTTIGVIAIILFLCLCCGLIFVANRLNNRQALESLPPTQTEPPAHPDNLPPQEPIDEGPQPEELPEQLPNLPGERPLFLPPPDEIRPPEELEPLLAEDPENPQLRAELAISYLRNGRSEDARAIIGNVFRRVRLPVQFIITSERLMEGEQYELAALVLQEGLSRYHQEPQMQHMLLIALIEGEVPDQAIEEYLEFLPEEPTPEGAFNIQLGEIILLYRHENADQALRELARLVEDPENPFRASTFYLMGLYHLDKHNPEAAREAFEQALAHEPPPWLVMQIEKRMAK